MQTRNTPPRFVMKSALVIALASAAVPALAQSPMSTVLSKPAKSAPADFAPVLAQCTAPELPMALSAGISLVASKVASDQLDGRAISLRTYRFSHALDKVLPELERAGVVLRFDPLGDLRKLPVGTVWHGFNEMDGLGATRELTCSRIVQ